MANYKCTILRWDRHGQYGTEHHLLAEVEVIAKNMKEAKEKALLSMIGKRSAEIGEIGRCWNRPIGFPIDFEHAPEATKDEINGCWSMTWEGTQNHTINEYDIRNKYIMVKAEKKE